MGVELDAFVNGILESTVPSNKLEMMNLAAETKRCSDQQIQLLTSFQNHFDELFRRIPNSISAAGQHRAAPLLSPQTGNDGSGSSASYGGAFQRGTPPEQQQRQQQQHLPRGRALSGPAATQRVTP